MHLLALLVVTATPNVQLWIEHGGNFEPLANERFMLRWDGTLLIERGKPVQKKDPKYGQVTSGTCERFTWKLGDKQSNTLRQLVADARLPELEPNYVEKGVHDGTQGALVAIVDGARVVSTFDNKFPPAYQAVLKALRELEATLPKVKPSRCDTATWFFLRAPLD